MNLDERERKMSRRSTMAKMSNSSQVSLRRSTLTPLRRAKSKTLRMTAAIVAVFLICWTPYFIATALHFLDSNLHTGEKVNRIQYPVLLEKFLYIFAVFNSCINPYLYGYFSFKLQAELRDLFSTVYNYWIRRKVARTSARPRTTELSESSMEIQRAECERNRRRRSGMSEQNLKMSVRPQRMVETY